jgi:hypothetical protein
MTTIRTATLRTVEDLLYAVAARAKVLAEDKVDNLRASVETAQETRAAAIAENRHKTKGDLIEEILIEEFEEAAKKFGRKPNP